MTPRPASWATSNNPRMLIRTSTGIEIGRAYVPPPAHLWHEAERIQALLLRKPSTEHPITRLGHAVVPWVALAGLVAGIVLIINT